MDRLFGLAGAAAALLSFGLFAWLIWDLVRLGWARLSWEFLLGEVEDSGRSGGIGPLLVSTIWILACCLGCAIPLGTGCAFWLSEFVRRGSLPARIVIGVTLGIGRALSETAALLFTSGYSTRMPESLSDSGRALSVHIYDLALNVAHGGPMASSSALVLLALILVINATAVALSDHWLRRRSLPSGTGSTLG